MAVHPLATMIADAARGSFPPVDGGWREVPPWRPGLEAVLAFTGHAVLALEPGTPLPRPVDGFGGAHDPRLVAAIAGDEGWIDSIDALLVAHGRGGHAPLVRRPDLESHPRVGFARAIRDDLVVLGRPGSSTDVAVLGRGVAGLVELSVELDPAHRGRGAGARWIADALHSLPAGEPVVAAVAPGNAASLRAFLGAGFVPVCSMQLFRRAAGPDAMLRG